MSSGARLSLRFGPVVPPELAAAKVWQPPQPLLAKTWAPGPPGTAPSPSDRYFVGLTYSRAKNAFWLGVFSLLCLGPITGIPAVYVPFPIGNGEQRFNAAGVVRAGGGILVDDAAFLPSWVDAHLLPLLADRGRVAEMSARAASAGVRDGSDRMVSLIRSGLSRA